jgi:ribosomal protein S27AE
MTERHKGFGRGLRLVQSRPVDKDDAPKLRGIQMDCPYCGKPTFYPKAGPRLVCAHCKRRFYNP